MLILIAIIALIVIFKIIPAQKYKKLQAAVLQELGFQNWNVVSYYDEYVTVKSRQTLEKYDDIKQVTGNGYFVVVENGVAKIINKSGEMILNSGFDSVEAIQVDNFIIIKEQFFLSFSDENAKTPYIPDFKQSTILFSDLFS